MTVTGMTVTAIAGDMRTAIAGETIGEMTATTLATSAAGRSIASRSIVRIALFACRMAGS